MDTRGHGNSGGKCGHSPSYDQLMYDIQSLIYFVQEKTPNQNGNHIIIKNYYEMTKINM